MVLFRLEEALGQMIYRLENISGGGFSFPDTEPLSSQTQKLEKLGHFDRIKNKVEDAYLDDLFKMLMSGLQEERLRTYVKYLKSLFEAGDVFNIRNALAHPNRPFLPCYWYRVAAMCSDPIIESLGFEEVTKALISAEEDMLTDPPDDWVERYLWLLPNNLPLRFDHEVTGLIGRDKELDSLFKLLKNPRVKVIAIIAPGGFGKTALVLHALRDSINKPETASWAESIIFITLKSEYLSATGVIPFNNASTIKELIIEILDALNGLYEEDVTSLDEAFEVHGNKRILLFIDNLETLIRDDISAFESFNLSLPEEWRLLITSRVNVSSATAFRLEPLKKGPAIALARAYLAVSGDISTRFKEGLFETIATECEFNPLAIRLTLDLYKIHPDIKKSIQHTKKNILEFSYTNLIDSLSKISVSIIEALFLKQPLSRREFCEILELSLDDASEAIQELKQTSLLIANVDENEELYELSPSVRELLGMNSKDLCVRANISKKLEKQKLLNDEIRKRQKNAGVTEWHQFYFSPDLPSGLKILLEGAVRLIISKGNDRNKDYTVPLRKLIDVRELYARHPIYHRVLSILYEKRHDLDQAEAELKLALSLDASDPVNKLSLAEFYFGKRKDYSQAISLTQPLIDEGFDDTEKCNGEFSNKLVKIFLQSLLYDGKCDEILRYTQSWEKSPLNQDIKGVMRAAAFRKSIEDRVDKAPQDAIGPLDDALKTIGNVFRLYGYSGFSSAYALKIYDEVIRYLSGNNRKALTQTKIKEWLEILDKHWHEAVKSKKRDNDYVAECILKLEELKIHDNPFRAPRWKYILEQIKGSDSLDLSQNLRALIQVNITVKTDHGYAFAVDNSGKQYYLHVSKMADNDQDLWANLHSGDIVKIQISEEVGAENNEKTAKRIAAELIYIP